MKNYVSKNTFTFEWSTDSGKPGKEEMNKKKKIFKMAAESSKLKSDFGSLWRSSVCCAEFHKKTSSMKTNVNIFHEDNGICSKKLK